jgi:hypothetical protein
MWCDKPFQGNTEEATQVHVHVCNTGLQQHPSDRANAVAAVAAHTPPTLLRLQPGNLMLPMVTNKSVCLYAHVPLCVSSGMACRCCLWWTLPRTPQQQLCSSSWSIWPTSPSRHSSQEQKPPPHLAPAATQQQQWQQQGRKVWLQRCGNGYQLPSLSHSGLLPATLWATVTPRTSSSSGNQQGWLPAWGLPQHTSLYSNHHACSSASCPSHHAQPVRPTFVGRCPVIPGQQLQAGVVCGCWRRGVRPAAARRSTSEARAWGRQGPHPQLGLAGLCSSDAGGVGYGAAAGIVPAD